MGFFFSTYEALVVVNISFDFCIVSALIGLRLFLLGGQDCSPCYNFCNLKFLYRNSLGSTHWRDFSSVSLIFHGWWILTAITDSQPKKNHLYKKNVKWEMAEVSIKLWSRSAQCIKSIPLLSWQGHQLPRHSGWKSILTNFPHENRNCHFLFSCCLPTLCFIGFVTSETSCLEMTMRPPPQITLLFQALLNLENAEALL